MSREKTKAELERELNQLKEAYRLRVIERDHAREVRDALENENKRLAGIISESLSEKRKATPADLASIQSGEQETMEKLRKEKEEIEQKFVDAVKYSCPEKYVKIFKDHGIGSPEDLDRALDRLLKMDACVMLVRNSRHDLAALADILATGGRP